MKNPSDFLTTKELHVMEKFTSELKEICESLKPDIKEFVLNVFEIDCADGFIETDNPYEYLRQCLREYHERKENEK